MQSRSIPVVFSPRYDMHLGGIEKRHPFDTRKYGRVFQMLCERSILTGSDHHAPRPVSEAELLVVHTRTYMQSLESAENIAMVAEVGELRSVPVSLLKSHLLEPMLHATGGTLLGVELALQHGWAVNLGAGYHHAKADKGSGFCYFADINLAIHKFLRLRPQSRLMVLDLDAHQGNGVEATLAGDPRVAVVDLFNEGTFPCDLEARRFIQYPFPLKSGCGTDEYLKLLRRELPRMLDEERPSFLIYNAGTDILDGDPLGLLAISKEGILERDLLVFVEAQRRGIPILMVLSGGYTQLSAGIIADSLSTIIPMMKARMRA